MVFVIEVEIRLSTSMFVQQSLEFIWNIEYIVFVIIPFQYRRRYIWKCVILFSFTGYTFEHQSDLWPLPHYPGSSSLMLSLQLLQMMYKSFPQIDTCMTLVTQRIHGNNAQWYVNLTIMVFLYISSQYNRQDGFVYGALKMGILCDLFCDLVLLVFHCPCVPIMQSNRNNKWGSLALNVSHWETLSKGATKRTYKMSVVSLTSRTKT